jgi:hypothetical protein
MVKDCPCTLTTTTTTTTIIIIIIMSMAMYQNKSKQSREGKVITYWNQRVQTARTIPNNKQDALGSYDRAS